MFIPDLLNIVITFGDSITFIKNKIIIGIFYNILLFLCYNFINLIRIWFSNFVINIIINTMTIILFLTIIILQLYWINSCFIMLWLGLIINKKFNAFIFCEKITYWLTRVWYLLIFVLWGLALWLFDAVNKNVLW